MVQISGFHHVSLPARDVESSADWYERVFGFECVLMEEDEDGITGLLLEHPVGTVLALYQSPDPPPVPLGRGVGTAVLGGDHRSLERLRQLATDVGASWHEIQDDEPAQAIVKFAREHQITQIVIGSSRHNRWQQLTGGGSNVMRIIRGGKRRRDRRPGDRPPRTALC